MHLQLLKPITCLLVFLFAIHDLLGFLVDANAAHEKIPRLCLHVLVLAPQLHAKLSTYVLPHSTLETFEKCFRGKFSDDFILLKQVCATNYLGPSVRNLLRDLCFIKLLALVNSQ